jgi:choline-glycine betaine transporter
MQPDDRSIHKFFAIRIFRHTNTSSIKTIIFYIMKTSHNLNNDMHAHGSLFIYCEAYPLFHYYEAYPLFIIMRLTISSIIMRLTLSSLLWGLPSLCYYETYPLFHYYKAYPFLVIMKLTLPLLCSCSMLYNSNSITYSLQIMLSSNNKSTNMRC